MKINRNRQITIERPSTTQDAVYGTIVPGWVPLVYAVGSPSVAERFWAEIQDVLPSRSESVQQGLVVSRNATRCRMLWRDDVDSTMRVTVHGDSDRVMQIIAGPAEIGGRKQYIEMMLEKVST